MGPYPLFVDVLGRGYNWMWDTAFVWGYRRLRLGRDHDDAARSR